MNEHAEAVPFARASAVKRTAEGTYDSDIPASWYQGRGAFGGLVAAQVLRAVVEHAQVPVRVPRSLTVHFCAPVKTGGHVIRIQHERSGAAVSHFTARVEQGGKVAAVATCTLAAVRPNGVAYNDIAMPEVMPWRSVTPVEHGPALPTFAQHYAFRFAGGSLPYSGSPHANVSAWLLAHEPTPLDAPHAVALLDAMPPAVFSKLDAFRPAASVDLTVHFFDPLETSTPMEEPVLLHTASVQAADGYAEECARLFLSHGRCVAQCRQLVALLDA